MAADYLKNQGYETGSGYEGSADDGRRFMSYKNLTTGDTFKEFEGDDQSLRPADLQKAMQAATDARLTDLAKAGDIQGMLSATGGDFTRVKQLNLLPGADWNQLGELGSSYQSSQDPGTMGKKFNQFLLGAGLMLGGGALGSYFGGPSAAAGASGAEFAGGLNVGPGAATAMGTGGGGAIPAAGLNPGASAPSVLGVGGASAPASGLYVSPEAMAAFGAGANLPYAAGSGIMAGGEGLNFAAPSSGAGVGPSAPGGLQVGPGAAEQLGVPSTAPAGGGPTAPVAPTPGAGAPSAGTSVVDNIIGQMKNNALSLGLMGTSLMMAGKSQPMPSQADLQGLSAEAQGVAKQLLSQYKSGQLSASQQASLSQLTQQTKNQITQYFASIGQADSTAHRQALAQVDQQAFAMQQQMLDAALQNGLQAIGVAQGPLNTVAQYQLGQDQALRQAYGAFAGAAGNMFGRNAGTQQPPAPQPTTVAPTISSARA